MTKDELLRYAANVIPKERLLPEKNVVVRSFNMDGDNCCVDIFRRPDGTYGFEEYRREPEDGRGWFAIGNYSSRSFATLMNALTNAKASVRWLALIANSE